MAKARQMIVQIQRRIKLSYDVSYESRSTFQSLSFSHIDQDNFSNRNFTTQLITSIIIFTLFFSHFHFHYLQPQFPTQQNINTSQGCDKFKILLKKWHQLHQQGKDRQRLNGQIRNEYKKLLKQKLMPLKKIFKFRLRDEVKKLIGKSDLKEKKSQLLEVRKYIQLNAMQRYKSWERQTKRKQFSKASLSHAEYVDPAQQQKQKTRDWMNSCIQKFRQQSQNLQQDGGEGSVVGGVNDEKRVKIQLYSFHENRIEMLLRLLENDAIPPMRLNQLRDNVQYLLQDPQDQNIHQSLQDDYKLLESQFSEDLSSINNSTTGGLTGGLSSEDISLEMEQNKEVISHQYSGSSSSNHSQYSGTSNSNFGGASSNNNSSSNSTFGKNKIHHQTANSNNGNKVSSVAGMTKKLPGKTSLQPSTLKTSKTPGQSGMTMASGGGKRYIQKMASSESPIKQQHPVVSSASAISMQSSASHAGIQSQVTKQPEDHNNSLSSSSMYPSLPYHHQKTDSTSSINSSTFTHQVISPSRGGFRSANPHHGRPTYQKKSCNLSINTSSEIKKDENLSKSLHSTCTTTDIASQQSKGSDMYDSRNQNVQQRKGQIYSDRKQYSDGKQGKVMPASDKKRYLKINQSDQTLRTLQSRLQQSTNSNSETAATKSSRTQEQQKNNKQKIRQQQEEQDDQDEDQDSVYEQNQTWTEQSSDENNNNNNSHLNKKPQPHPHQPQQPQKPQYSALQRLEASWNLRPTQQQKINYIPNFPVDTNVNCFPTMPLVTKQTDFSRLNDQSLFFAFYHQRGKLFQYLAAQELKKRKWAFHKKYFTWFLKLQDQPITINEQGQTGTYLYFDYDQEWCNRKKQDFTFEHNQRQSQQMIRNTPPPPPPPCS